MDDSYGNVERWWRGEMGSKLSQRSCEIAARRKKDNWKVLSKVLERWMIPTGMWKGGIIQDGHCREEEKGGGESGDGGGEKMPPCILRLGHPQYTGEVCILDRIAS